MSLDGANERTIHLPRRRIFSGQTELGRRRSGRRKTGDPLAISLNQPTHKMLCTTTAPWHLDNATGDSPHRLASSAGKTRARSLCYIEGDKVTAQSSIGFQPGFFSNDSL